MKARSTAAEGAEQAQTMFPVVAAAPPSVSSLSLVVKTREGPPSPLLRHAQSVPATPVLTHAEDRAKSSSLEGPKITALLTAAMQGTALPLSPKSKPPERVDEALQRIREALDKEVSERSEEDASLRGQVESVSARMDDLRKDFQGLMDLVLMELRCLVQEAQVLHYPRSSVGGRQKRRTSRRSRSISELIPEGGHSGPPPAVLMPALPEDPLGERISRLDEALEHEAMARVDLEERLHRRLEASLQELRVGAFLSRGSPPNVLEEKLRSQPTISPVVAAVKDMLEDHREYREKTEMLTSADKVRLRLVDCWRRRDCANTHAKEFMNNGTKQPSKDEHLKSDQSKDITVEKLANGSANEILVTKVSPDSRRDHDGAC